MTQPARSNLGAAISAAGLPALGAAVLLLYVTAVAVGVTPDSVIYLDAARHLADGQGYLAVRMGSASPQPVLHYPPLYPLALSVIMRLGLAPMAAARWLNAALFAANALLIGALVFRATGSSTAAFLGAYLAAASIPLIEIHSAAWSDPLFLLLFLLGLFFIDRALENMGVADLIFAPLALGCAWLTRYAGGSLVFAAVVGWLGLAREPLGRRAGHAALIACLGALPIGLWSLRNILIAGVPVDRTVRFEAFSFDRWITLFRIVGSWVFPATDRISIFPFQDAFIALFIIVGVTAAAFLRLTSKRTATSIDRSSSTIFSALLIFSAAYVASLLASILFFERGTPLDQRILSPLFAALLIVVIAYLTRLRRSGGRAAQTIVGLIAACAILAYTAAAAASARYLHDNGRGFAAKSWRYERILARLAASDQKLWIYSNHPAAIYFLTGRHASEIPQPGRDVSTRNPWYVRRPSGPALVLVFEEARKFTPRDAAAQKIQTAEAELSARVERLGGVILERERNAVLYRVERFP
ncbi:MAG TPA: glycosyltransferase family 39 protein [Verrucomicrobiae bacterium]|nr:glycosyltransferase family 39 protein [Verrucomicrobiae bacterium]